MDPHLNTKLSKKVAQLTRVIYLLNTRNDEHEYELQCLQQAHDEDVKAILLDAQRKLEDFKNRSVQSSSISHPQLQEMKQKWQDAQSQAQLQLADLKRQMQDSEGKLKATCKEQVETCRRQVDECKTQLLIKQHQFQKALRKLEESQNASLDELRKAKDAEIERVVVAVRCHQSLAIFSN